VRTANVEVKAMPVTIPAVGTAEPVTTVQVRAQVTGQLSKIHFSEGQEVRKGTPLFTLDSRPFEAALQQAQAVLARDTAQSKNAEAQKARYEDLFKRGLIPRDQYETQMATASALQATLEADRSQVENAKLNLQYTQILAPISGRTGALGVHEGDLIRANDTTPMVVINQVAPINVTFAVPGRYLTDIRINQARQPLKINVTSKPGEAPGAQSLPPSDPDSAKPIGAAPPTAGPTLREGGVVTFIDNAVDTTTGTIKLKGTFDNSDHGLWPGLFVQVSLVLSTDPKAVVVPAAAVQVSQTGQYVFVVKQDRTVEVRPVSIDRQQGEEMVIAKGLNPGEEVVTDGHLRLTAGARITTGTRGQGPAAEPGAGEGGRGNGAGGGGAGRGRRGNGEGNQS
jgi:multidrug efflux system membrane fusion protein